MGRNCSCSSGWRCKHCSTVASPVRNCSKHSSRAISSLVTILLQ
ncbi:MAG: SWIM zinc finger family protein [Anaerolineales bacterium]|nr:SWIM zinc finger family protein [Anaerolineales bacterium]MCW5855943.1 SWIM zinc finger family protein [Anaerolineales bacterium]